jgi:hypothetical protein
MKKQCLFISFCFLSMVLMAQTRQQLRDSAARFPAMPRETGQLFAFNGSSTFSSGTPFNDIEFTIFDTDYMEGETHGYDLFMPVDPSDAFPGANKVKLIRGTGNVDLDFSYGGSKGDRLILGTHEVSVPFFLRGADGIDNDYAVVQNYDFTNGFIQLKGTASDYQMPYFKLSDSVRTEGYYLFYTKGGVADLVAFIFPCWDLGLPISGNAPRNPLALCNADSSFSLTNPRQFKYATPISTTLAVSNGIAQFGSNGKEVVGALTVDYQDNCYLAGLTDGNLDGRTDAPNETFITKISPSGQVLWTTELATAEGTLIIDATTDSTFLYAAGRTLGALSGFTNRGRWDGILLKIRLDNGQIVASNQWGNAGIDGYGNIILDDAGNLFISGQGSPDAAASTDDLYLFAKHRKSDLSNVWRVLEPPVWTGFKASAECWGGLSYIPSTTKGDGKVVIGGWFMAQQGAVGFLAVYDSLNSTIGTRRHFTTVNSTGIRADWVLDNAVDKDGNIYAVGFTTGNLQGSPLGEGDAYIVKFNPDLTNPRYVQIGTNKGDMFRKLDIDNKNGRVFAVGYTYGHYTTPNYQGTNADATLGSGDILVQKFDLNLNRLEARQFGTPYEDRALCALKDSVLYVGGMTEGALAGQNRGAFDGFLVALKTSDLSFTKPIGTAVLKDNPLTINVFPNPTTGLLSISAPSVSTLNFSIFNSIGQVVNAGILSESKTLLDLTALPSGVYFLALRDQTAQTVLKVVKN